MPLPLLPTSLYKLATNVLAGSGVVALVASTSTLAEHIDDIMKVVGILFLVLAWWLRSWMVERKLVEQRHSDKIEKLGDQVAEMREAIHNVVREFTDEMRSLRRDRERTNDFRLWVVGTLGAVAARTGVAPAPVAAPLRDSGEVKLAELEQEKG